MSELLWLHSGRLDANFFLLPLSLSPGPPPLETPLQVKWRDETCFPLCYLHNVQQVHQALVTFNNISTRVPVRVLHKKCLHGNNRRGKCLFCVNLFCYDFKCLIRGENWTSSSLIRRKNLMVTQCYHSANVLCCHLTPNNCSSFIPAAKVFLDEMSDTDGYSERI